MKIENDEKQFVEQDRGTIYRDWLLSIPQPTAVLWDLIFGVAFFQNRTSPKATR